MTSISMYQASVPVFKKMLGNLSAILDMASAYATARKIDPEVLLRARLAPDMIDLMRNVHIAVDGTTSCVARLAGVEVPAYPRNETSFAHLIERIAKAIEFLESFTPAQLDGSEDRHIEFKILDKTAQFRGIDYLLHFTNMNLPFHITVVYAILRHNGLELGKRHYLGGGQAG